MGSQCETPPTETCDLRGFFALLVTPFITSGAKPAPTVLRRNVHIV